MCAVRVQNTRERDVHFQSHASFYATPIKEPRHHLSVHVNGVFAKPVLVHNDCLRPGERATLYFPFHADKAGAYRLQLLIAEQHADPVSRSGAALLETDVRVTRDRVDFDAGERIRRALFTLWHTELPIRVKALQRHVHRRRLEGCGRDAAARRRAMAQYKKVNEELAFMEKQVRRGRVASLPCYLAIDTTSKCNLECKMCFRSYAGVDYNATPDLPVEILDRLIGELFPTAMTLNLSTIGEPLMSPYMDKILDACAAYQVYLSVTTNGTMMRGDDFIKRLASVLHHIEISVDSVTPERFKAFRSGASYQKVLGNASKLGAIRRGLPDPKFNLGFSMTLFRENLEEIPDVLRVVADVGGNFLKADIGVVFSKSELPHVGAELSRAVQRDVCGRPGAGEGGRHQLDDAGAVQRGGYQGGQVRDLRLSLRIGVCQVGRHPQPLLFRAGVARLEGRLPIRVEQRRHAATPERPRHRQRPFVVQELLCLHGWGRQRGEPPEAVPEDRV